MKAQQLISPKVIPLSPGMTSAEALNMMHGYSVDHLPVVEDGRYLGLISVNELLEAEDKYKKVGSYSFTTEKAYVEPGVHIFEVVNLTLDLDLTLVPVVDSENTYLGAITLHSLIESFAEITSVKDPGGIVKLSMPLRDYTLSEIARIVESNQARILTSYVRNFPEDGLVEVTIKIDKSDLTSILSTFERYEYTIKETYQETVYNEDLKERFESLMKYLNI